MTENGFSSPRNDAFPAGLRVLVVDDDPTWLKILEKMLKKCSYEVTTCGLARDALNLLRERKDGYDIVISDVNMPDMDGFKLLEHVGLEMDLPVIMMSVDGETSRVMKGVQHGACDYLLKPIRMKELRNIWQHVLRKKIHEVRDIEILEGMESIQMGRIGPDHSDDGHLFSGEDLTSLRKRKEVEGKHDDKDHGESSSTKKPRVVWSVDLHQKFVKAVNQTGFDKVGPKKILDLMNVPWLTRENVASHLQKYRLYLSRLQKENDLKNSVGGIKHSDSPLRESSSSFVTQNSMQNEILNSNFGLTEFTASFVTQNDSSNSNYGFSGNSLLVQKPETRSHESEQKGNVSKNTAESKRALVVDVPNPHKPRSSQIEFGRSFSGSEVKLSAFDSNFETWRTIPGVQMKQENKPLHLDDRFIPLHLPGEQEPIQADFSLPVPPKCSVTKTEIDSGNVQTKTYTPNHQVLEAISASTLEMGTHISNLNCISDLESAEKCINWGTLDDDWRFCFVQGDCYAMNLGLPNIEFPENYFPGFTAEGPAHSYDAVRDYEYLRDPSEYSLIGQGYY